MLLSCVVVVGCVVAFIVVTKSIVAFVVVLAADVDVDNAVP